MPDKIFIIASELGNVNRGYEASLRECFDALCQSQEFDFFLFKGNGKRDDREFVIPNIPSSTPLAFNLGKLTRKGRDGERFIHELSYFFPLVFYIEKYKPSIIYLNGDKLAKLLYYWRKTRSLSYKILFRNGGPMLPPFFYSDLVQHLTPVHFDQAIDFGEPKVKHWLLPTGFNLSKDYSPLSRQDQIALRHSLGLPTDKRILLSVAAIDKHHKRIDYLIREVHRVSDPQLCLVVLGQQYPESREIIQLGYQLLGNENFIAREVQRTEVDNYYKAADLFVLTSLKEGFGRVYVEAMSYGLPCLTHNYAVPHYVLGDQGYYGNLTQPGGLVELLLKIDRNQFTPERSKQRVSYIYDRFSWDRLYDSYMEMFTHCLSH